MERFAAVAQAHCTLFLMAYMAKKAAPIEAALRALKAQTGPLAHCPTVVGMACHHCLRILYAMTTRHEDKRCPHCLGALRGPLCLGREMAVL